MATVLRSKAFTYLIVFKEPIHISFADFIELATLLFKEKQEMTTF